MTTSIEQARPRVDVPATGPLADPAANAPGGAPPGSGRDAGPVSRDTAAASVSPKVAWATAASALATLIWTLVGVFAPQLFTASTIATLTGATATLFAFFGGFLVNDQLRRMA
jgi:hypothetical protein